MLVLLVALLAAATHALDNIAVPSTIAAGQSFQATFDDGNSDTYRVYLAASLTGVNGPTCYLQNSTTLSGSLTLSVPADVGPSADHYSIAILDLTNNGSPVYSNTFDLTGATGSYTNYEFALGGAPFWDPNDLPCSAYSCARSCASASYPEDLTQTSAYSTMESCILACGGVSPAPSQTAPAHVGASLLNVALITLASGKVVTAVPTTAVVGGSTIPEAVLGGSLTITLGASAATVNGVTASLATDGVAVDGTTTVPFTSPEFIAASATTTTSPVTGTATVADVSQSSHGVAARHEAAIAGLLGFAGVAALAL